MRTVPLATILITMLSPGCTMQGNGGDGAGNDNNPSSDNTVTLDVVARADEAFAVPGAIYAVISDHVISRADIGANLSNIVTVISPQHGIAGEVSGSLEVERGRTVTLIAVEELGGVLVSRADDLDAFVAQAPPEATEFAAWDGDYDSSPEAGMAAVASDRDRTVFADFALMRGVLVESIGCGSLAVGWSGSGYLELGPLVENFQAAESFIPRQTGQNHPFVYVYNKIDTTFTFKTQAPEEAPAGVVDFETTGFLQWSGGGEECGFELTCEVTREQGVDNDETIRLINSYTAEADEITVTNGYGCGLCTTFDPSATCDDFRDKLIEPE